MFGRDSRRSSRIDILIGKTARIQGDVDFSGGLHLDGQVTGNVRADGEGESSLSVSDTGCIDGSVIAPTVLLDGTVRGDIHARTRLVLGPHAKVQGDVYYGVIETSLGAEILGRLVPLSAAPSEASPVAAAPAAG
jgi:cytoskeletal protein CcmA (bactofilin family)